MHHSVCLKMTTLTSKEMLAQWQQHNPQFKEALRLLEADWLMLWLQCTVWRTI